MQDGYDLVVVCMIACGAWEIGFSYYSSLGATQGDHAQLKNEKVNMWKEGSVNRRVLLLFCYYMFIVLPKPLWRARVKGKNHYRIEEIDIIKHLLQAKLASSPTQQKIIRRKLRQIGFYISDFPFAESASDIDRLIENGHIVIIDADPTDYSSEFSLKIATRRQGMITKAIKDKSDENYIIDLCDEILGQKASRQHRFPFLVGDPGRNGNCCKLPVDAYYKSLKLVVEYRERQHIEYVGFFDNKKTSQGITRGEQRQRYDKLRRIILPLHGIQLIELSFNQFSYNSAKRLLRNKTDDIEILRTIIPNGLLSMNIPSE